MNKARAQSRIWITKHITQSSTDDSCSKAIRLTQQCTTLWVKLKTNKSDSSYNCGNLAKIKGDKFYLVRKNPEEFIAKVSKIINEAKAKLIINNIVYHKIEDKYDAKTVFTNDNAVLRNSINLKKHIYDHLTSDSSIETEFAKALDQAVEVVVYAKLPKSFYITTPVGRYSPDWAIVFDKEKVRYIYFVAETKGSDSSMELRGTENLKIHCSKIHFEVIAGADVKYDVVNYFDKLMELVQLK